MNTSIKNNLIEAFAKSLADSAQSLAQTGKLLVEIVETIPDGLKLLRERIPGLSNTTIEGLLKVGRGQIYDRLLLADGPGVARLRKCDIALQKHHYREPVPVLVKEGSRTTHLLVSVFDMTADQADQVFERGTVRTLEQQRQWLESRKAKPENIALEKPYTVRNGKITFSKPCTLTVQQLSLLLVEATS